ncbi:MAG: DUF5706 domain-containing protein [bacterium]|nr:DUF5706 domain-containing protein [bacterium]
MMPNADYPTDDLLFTATANSMQTILLESKVRRALELLVIMQKQVEMADRKAQAIIGANTLLVAAYSFTSSTFRNNDSSVMQVILFILQIGLLVALGISALSVLLTIMPRVEKSDTEESVYFFGRIAKTPTKSFMAQYIAQNPQQELIQILNQIHATSRIISSKYTWAGRSSYALVVALMLWLIIQTLNFVA